MENCDNCAVKIKEQLKKINQEIKQISNDTTRMQWGKVDLDKHQDMLKFFGVNRKRIVETLHKLKTELINPAKEVTKLENNLGHLFVDIESGHIEEKKAAGKCTFLQKETNTLSDSVERTRQHLTYLQDAAQTVRSYLAPDKLIPLAEKVATGKNIKNFNVGLSYLALLDDKDGKATVNLKQLQKDVEQVEVKFIRLEFPELPKLAETILANHVNTCISVLQLTRQFIETTKASGTKKLKSLENLTDILKAHSSETLSGILDALPDLIKKLSNIICDLHHDANVIAEVKRLESLTQTLNNTHVALKNDYLPHLSGLTSSTSPLAPDITANRMSNSFFRGFKGIIRNFRLMLGGPDRGDNKPDRYLTGLLIKTIETCPYYYGAEASDITKITAFIDSLLVDCPRPFPYEDFFKTIKNTISMYGESVERDFYRFKLHVDEALNGKEGAAKTIVSTTKTSFGRILSKVEARSEHLKDIMQKSD
jgi:hypothetical protein